MCQFRSICDLLGYKGMSGIVRVWLNYRVVRGTPRYPSKRLSSREMEVIAAVHTPPFGCRAPFNSLIAMGGYGHEWTMKIMDALHSDGFRLQSSHELVSGIHGFSLDLPQLNLLGPACQYQVLASVHVSQRALHLEYLLHIHAVSEDSRYACGLGRD